MWPCRQILYVKNKRLRWKNNAYLENMDMSTERKQRMRLKTNVCVEKTTHTSKIWTCQHKENNVCVEKTTHTSKIWTCLPKENNFCVWKTTSYLEKEANAMVYPTFAVGRRADTCNKTMITLVWKKLLFRALQFFRHVSVIMDFVKLRQIPVIMEWLKRKKSA